jgi:carboxymethylenebutenolidase
LRTETVDVPVGDTQLDAYLAEPAEPGTYPGLVVIHEAFGPVPHIHDVTRRFANLGYIALAPNLYHRIGAPNPDDLSTVMPKMLGLPDAQTVADLEAAAAYLRKRPGNNGRVGSIGFCSGGRQSLLFACRSAAVDAAVDCWGGFIDRASPDADVTPQRPEPVIDMLGGVSCPLFVIGGTEDENPSPEVLGRIVTELGRANRTGAVKLFADAGHAFLADYRPSYREGPAHELWADVTAFFQRHLH